jgi:excisionase family DNA binding protein
VPPTLSIEPDTVYSEGAVALALDLPLATLARARRDGRLRFTRQGRRVLIRGAWLLAWLESSAAPAVAAGGKA